MSKKTLSIFGFGRFGQLMAKLLAEDFEVVVANAHLRNKPAEFKTVSIKEAARANYVLLCVPISTIDEVTKELALHISPTTAVVDTCSVKIFPIKTMRKNLPNNKVLGTHPLFGPDSINGGLEGKKIVVCDDYADGQVLSFWKKYWQSKNAEVLEMSADEHDKQAAASQGLAHLIGRILADMSLPDIEFSTKGSKDLVDLVTQTSNDSWQLFDDLQRFNPYSAKMRDSFESSHDKIKQRLDDLIN